jgi:hypothetical protein
MPGPCRSLAVLVFTTAQAVFLLSTFEATQCVVPSRSCTWAHAPFCSSFSSGMNFGTAHDVLNLTLGPLRKRTPDLTTHTGSAGPVTVANVWPLISSVSVNRQKKNLITLNVAKLIKQSTMEQQLDPKARLQSGEMNVFILLVFRGTRPRSASRQ